MPLQMAATMLVRCKVLFYQKHQWNKMLIDLFLSWDAWQIFVIDFNYQIKVFNKDLVVVCSKDSNTNTRYCVFGDINLDFKVQVNWELCIIFQ